MRVNLRFVLLILLAAFGKSVAAAGPVNPIMFVTQIPVPADFTTIGSVFGNHGAGPEKCGRGGDLYIRYPDGSLKNLTAAAGFGAEGFQGATSIAVRDPSIHWNGTKAIFSMVVGTSIQQYNPITSNWQIYEITGFGQNETPVITKVLHQPDHFNNVAPIYGTDGRIIYISDRPRNGQAHLYPQLDEYELAPTNTGLWSLDPQTGDLFQLDHAVSGDFSPNIDSFGRIIFTRWDHLQRDQEADADADSPNEVVYGTFNYSNETASALILTNNRTEVFPEPRSSRIDLLAGTNLKGHTFNFFFPWMINQDGTEAETLNHVGRQELASYIDVSLTDDPNLDIFYNSGARFNTNAMDNFLQIKEDPRNPGTYFGTDAPEFATHAGGQIVSITAPPGLDADHMKVTYYTDRSTASFTSTPTPENSGHYRDPLPTSDGLLIAAHAPYTGQSENTGTSANPHSPYDYRLKTLRKTGAVWAADQPLTPGITKTVSYYSEDLLVSYSGPLWELNPVEVRSRPIPNGAKTPLPDPEKQILAEEGVNVQELQSFLRANDLALIVSRNVTTRDRADKQQPFNLRVAGGTTQTIGASGKIYDIKYLQLFEADQLRGYGLGYGAGSPPRPGRRVIAQPLNDPSAASWLGSTGPSGAVQLGADGSMAAFVPARRAMTWQLTDPTGTPVVRERFWLTFQPGEIRSCTSCHGLNTRDQASNAIPANKPEALRTLLKRWKTNLTPASAPTLDLHLKSIATKPLTIEASQDFNIWTPILTNDPGASLIIHFADPQLPALPHRFYRAVQP